MSPTMETTQFNKDDLLIAKPGEPIVNITSFTARQKASGYISSHISHLMGSQEPSLILSNKRLVWRVPIILTSPNESTLGIVGTLDVDTRTGQLIIPDNFSNQLEANAQKIIASR